jgi:hypothetical protein
MTKSPVLYAGVGGFLYIYDKVTKMFVEFKM